MLENLVPEYILKEVLTNSPVAYAITDEHFNIIWFNKTFGNQITETKIKNKQIFYFFGELSKENCLAIKANKSKKFKVSGKSKFITITFLNSDDTNKGYLLKLENADKTEALNISDNELLQKNLIFQKELQQILSLLVTENSLEVLTSEILIRCHSISESDFCFAMLIEDKNKLSFKYYDPLTKLASREDLEKEIKSNFPFINKWLSVNQKALLITNSPENIGFQLARYFDCKSLIFAPCFSEDSLSAAIILGKFKGNFTPIEINNVENFAVLLSFAINSIKTRELNNALESRLLQSQKLETIGKLSSGMAHDFNNLLSSIFGSLNLLKKRVPQQENIYRLLDNIESCSIRAKDLTKGLLSYGKPTPKRKELIKPNLLLSEITKVINETFPHSINFENKVEKKLYDMLGNPTEIYQVLLNLCVNAKEALENGEGTISLTAQKLTIDNNAINFPLLNKGNYVRISVSDTGTGIEEENLQKIFDPYFSTKGKETGSGSGLGLYITYGIIKAHQGHVDVSSKIGEGTTFDVFIPAYEPAKEKEVSASEKIILLADDEVMLRDLLAELLESTGYNVIRVTTGEEALKVLTEEIKVDLAIIDYNMPGMSGLECIAKIRKLKIDTPVILSSGSLSLTENIDLENKGIDNMLPKPYEFDTMLDTIKKLI